MLKANEKQQTRNVLASSNDTDPPPPETTKVLIIGDSMLRDFDDNTFDNAEVKAFSGAKMLEIFKELNCRSDLNTFKDIIIHCGTNDISSGTPLPDVLSTLEASITFIQVEAPATKVHISSLCPRTNPVLNAAITEMNNELKDLSLRLDCGFIDSSVKLTFRNGAVDASQLRDGLHLNERGAETLANTFGESVQGLTVIKNTWSIVSRHKRYQRRRDNLARTQTQSNRPSRTPQVS